MTPQDQCRELLRHDGLDLTDAALVALERHCALVREWNRLASLVSQGDAADLWSRHVADALSLAGWVARFAGRGPWLDIGPGGGFPLVPVKILVPELPVTAVERSEKKAGFLVKVRGALGLEGMEIVTGEFPQAYTGGAPAVITARAVERPARLWKGVAETLREGGVFLCQSGPPPGGMAALFHVEHCRDRWTESGFRRGDLWVVRRGAGS